MKDTFRLGRIGGVRVGVNWTVLVIFALVTYALAAERLPRDYKGLHPAVYALGGLGTALGFVTCLLAHELTHAIVARRNGLTVQGVTLWLLGGIARFEGEPATPGAELRIAGSGPLVNLVLGGLLGAVSVALAPAGASGMAAGCTGWLAAINLVLAVFNIVPAVPLDGGRLVHALMWRLSGDRTKATLHTAVAGRAFGWVTMAGGCYLTLYSPDGLWLIIVGWFLITAAGLETAQAQARARLDGITIRRIMTPDPFTVPAAMTVAEFRHDMLPRHRHAAYPVRDGERIPGVVTVERIQGAPPDTPVGALAEEAGHAEADTPLAGLLARLPRERLLVFDGDRLIGIVTPHDLTRELERLTREARPSPAG